MHQTSTSRGFTI